MVGTCYDLGGKHGDNNIGAANGSPFQQMPALVGMHRRTLLLGKQMLQAHYPLLLLCTNAAIADIR